MTEFIVSCGVTLLSLLISRGFDDPVINSEIIKKSNSVATVMQPSHENRNREHGYPHPSFLTEGCPTEQPFF